MLHTVTIQQASEELVSRVRALHPGNEIVLTDGAQRIARIVPEPAVGTDRRPGLCKGMLEMVDDGEGDILEHFKDYVP